MRPRGSAEALAMRRRIAARMLQPGKGIREVRRAVGVSAASLPRWNTVWLLQEAHPELSISKSYAK